ncbi:hypothetical protein NGTWS0302_35010 [Mycolicibacterium cyprinidarum]|uniref:Uncharacterized protein n=1 Tax=Mycolicibacterium cyprinidarum TaxID=2860311 RepID=A0ABQ4V993_9MYCO|nr:hypothetical protein NGTWS0302_35010 [Mycolicibacterium sp. NGTWS0302]GJF15020.1 hypothetical protein NGTWS1702_17750 [Mycolicibacterium sp. NGTWSNA01]
MNDAMAFGLELMTGVLAEDGPRQTGPDFGKASPFGLIVIVLLLLGTFGLVWSMNRHLRRLPKSFDTGSPDGSGSAGETRGEENPAHVDPDITTEPPSDGTSRGPG